ncbi:PLK2 kinase, partial [Indicator maculatus]|nr:PLK2 kinase [Indicator maculatus]
TPNYLAPEVLDRRGHGVPSDIWALGCATYEALTGTPPFGAARRQELFWRIRGAQYPAAPQLSAPAQALITLMLQPEPTARPSLQHVLQHSFLIQVWGRGHG